MSKKTSTQCITVCLAAALVALTAASARAELFAPGTSTLRISHAGSQKITAAEMKQDNARRAWLRRLDKKPKIRTSVLGSRRTQSISAANATSLSVTAAGNDANACTPAAPCNSLARAAAVAVSGDTVEVSGSLGDQFFAGGYQGTQADVAKTLTFHGQPGNKLRAIHFGSGNFTFDGINIDAGGGAPSPAFSNGGAPFTYKNGSIGNVIDEKGAMIDGPGMVFDNVLFHDIVLRTAGVHTECIFAEVPEGMIVRNSTFTNCAVMDMFFVYPDWWAPLPSPYKNVTLDNNTFGHPDGTFALYIAKIGMDIPSSAPVTGWKIRNNNLLGPVNIDAPLGTNNAFCGNFGVGVPTGWTAVCGTPPPPPPTTTTTPTTTTVPTTTTTPTTTPPTTTTPGSGGFAGDQALEPAFDSSPSGQAEAFQTTATANGTVNRLSVYLSSANAATSVKLGLYSDAAGRPGSLLGSATVATPVAAAWNSATLSNASVTAGTSYWIALLGVGGTVGYRDRCCGAGSPANAASGTLSALPAAWTAASTYVGSDGPLSAYVDSTTGAPPPADAPPTAPTALAVTPASSLVTLTWTASTDDKRVTGYNVYLDGTLRATVTGTSYAYSTLVWGTHTLKVEAVDSAGQKKSTSLLITSRWS
jgi:hypothetical protein